MPFCFRPLALGLALFLVPQFLVGAAAQNLIANRVLPSVSTLREMNRSSGYIFDGTVVSVRPVTETGPESMPTVEITFRVQQAVRGTRRGQVLTIREWAGLWSSGERYRPGERLLLFLYHPSKLGLTSTVGGSLGRFAVDSRGNVVLENGRLAALSLDPFSQTQLRGQTLVSSRALALAIERSQGQHSIAQRSPARRPAAVAAAME